jgi:hypothetical protein
MMKDEVIKELFDNHKPTEEEKRIYYDTADFVFAGFHSGCRVTEPLAKIEVLEKLHSECKKYHLAETIQGKIDDMIAELKEAIE